MTQKNLEIDMTIDHVIGILNGFTDAVIRGISATTLNTKHKKYFLTNEAASACLQVNPSVKQVALRRFQPIQELMSHIECILLEKSTGHLPELCKNNLGGNFSRQTIKIQFCCNQLELDPCLKQLSLVDQNIVAIYYLDHLTSGHMYHGFQVRYSTLKEYMNVMCALVKIYTGSDIRIQPDIKKTRKQWLPHLMINIIYEDTKDWQGMARRQDPISKLMIN